MAKRKRLSPARSGFLSDPQIAPSSSGVGRAPIAQVAGDTAAAAALEEVADAMRRARAEGRLVQALPLDAIVPDHLIRDRAEIDNEAQNALEQSLMARGQQTPVEVMDLGDGRFGLISGWRRLRALKKLRETGGSERFNTVLALVRRPDTVADSYIAMVEENEIRVDLSLYERARIVLKALEAGIFETEKQALQSLFSAVSYAKRSKIKSLLPVVAALDGSLRFPGRMTERTGLALAKVLSEDPDCASVLREALVVAAPDTAEAEASVLIKATTSRKRMPAGTAGVIKHNVLPGLTLKVAQGRVELTGADVDDALAERLRVWLQAEFGQSGRD